VSHQCQLLFLFSFPCLFCHKLMGYARPPIIIVVLSAFFEFTAIFIYLDRVFQWIRALNLVYGIWLSLILISSALINSFCLKLNF
jgi:hypothetical protein